MIYKPEDNVRRQAAEEFCHSIEKLKDNLSEDIERESQRFVNRSKNSSPPAPKHFDIAELEEAVADIDEYLQSKNYSS